MGKMKYGKLSVGKNIYIIMFIQCVPGSEEDICAHLSAKLNYTNSKYYLYYSFSEFDIIAVVQLDHEHELDSFTALHHPKIRDFQQVICYLMKETDRPIELDSALSITLFKFDEERIFQKINQKVMDIEGNVFNLIEPIYAKSKRTGMKSWLLGSLGWPEAILIQSGNNLPVLLNNIPEIADRGQFEELQISHTFPCVRRKPSENSKNFVLEHVEGRLDNWRIAVSCRPHTAFRLQNHLHTQFQIESQEPLLVILTAFGRRDLFIYPNPNIVEGKINTFDRLGNLLALIRSNYAKDIVATHTDFGLPFTWKSVQTNAEAEKEDSIKEKRAVQRQSEFDNLQEKLDEFGLWEDERKNLTLKQTGKLTQMVLRLQAIAAAPGLESIADDLLEFVKATVQKAYSQIKRISPVYVSDENRASYEELEERENALFFGLQQRMVGAQLGLGHPSQAYSNLQGFGIQQVLRASKAIPFGLLKGVNEEVAQKWWGFTLFGFYNETLATKSGVINLPYQDIFQPEEWWRLGHECGHIFGFVTDLENNRILKEALEKVNKSLLQSSFASEPIPLIGEMIVSIFEYLYCYRCDFDLYLKTTWRFFDNLLEGLESSEMLKQYLLRTVFVYFFHLQIHDAVRPREPIREILDRGLQVRSIFTGDTASALKARAFGEAGSLENLIRREIMNPIDQEVSKINFALRRVNLTDVIEGYNTMDHIRSDLADLFENYQEMGRAERKDIKRYMNRRLRAELSSISNSLRQGKVIVGWEDDLDVFLIPLALQYQKYEKKEKISSRARIAAILSLCNMERKWRADNVA